MTARRALPESVPVSAEAEHDSLTDRGPDLLALVQQLRRLARESRERLEALEQGLGEIVVETKITFSGSKKPSGAK